MTTAYTAALHRGDETTFEQFTLYAARAMGAAIMQRDEASGPISGDYKVNTHHQDRHANAVLALADLSSLSLEAWARRQAEERTQTATHNRERDEKTAAVRARYEAMLAQVDSWRPPTSEHEGLKKFMQDQLRESIKFDCRRPSNREEPTPSVEEFRTQALKRAERDVDYHLEQWNEEQNRTAARNKWVRDLKNSLTTNTNTNTNTEEIR